MEGMEKTKDRYCQEVKSSSEEEFRKVEKVLAPFMWTLKKRKHEKADLLPNTFEELYLRRNPKELLLRLQKGFSDPLELRTLMNETAELLKVVTKSKNVNLYITDYDRGEIYLCPKYHNSGRFQRKYTIGTYVAAHVAFTKEYVLSSDILGDVRFPLGIPQVPVVKSVLCLPIITNEKENCVGVIELYRECSEKPYDLINLQICNALTAWMGIAVEQNAEKQNALKKLQTQKELSQLAVLYFSGVIPFPKTISDFLKVIKTAVKAEKAAFYVFSDPVQPGSEGTLFADAYEEGTGDDNETVLYRKIAKTRFAKNEPGISGYAARSGEILNIYDAYKDSRFDKKSDSPFFRTHSLAVFPIKTVNGVLAVLHLINSLNQSGFQEEEIELTESFLFQISMICEFYQINCGHAETQLRLEMSEKLLDFYTKPSEEELFQKLKNVPLGHEQPILPTGFTKFEWEPTNLESDIFVCLIQTFMSQEILEPCFDFNNLTDFLFRVVKSFRPNAFHNLDHGFSVLHFAFNMLLRIKPVYSNAETVAILLAALCHDIDHWGFTNTFLSLQNDTCYKLYGDVCGEAHRYELLLFLIDKSDLLSNFSKEDFTLIRENLQKLMMGFDLAIHFKNRQEITKLLNADSFSWDDPDHRILSQNMILICCDHSASFKSFDFVKKIAGFFYKELHNQGDLEKSMGFSPLPIMDRNKFDTHSDNELILLSCVLVPVVEILIRLFPTLNVLDDLIRNTMKEWSDVVQYRGTPMWRMKDALLKDKKERRVTTKVNLSKTLSSIKTAFSAF